MLLHRQKAILAMLHRAGRPVGRLELMKWAFLLRHEMPSSGGSSFYGFVPYHYGPFSFTLQREMAKLVESGLVREVDEHHWEFAESGASDKRHAPPTAVATDIDRLLARFAAYTEPNVVMDHVYREFPRYTVRSKRKRLAELPTAPPAVYTAGYEGLSVDEFLDLLVQSGIRRLIDVRSNPIARRYGYHKSTLARLCGALEIEYVHVRELGIASDQRQNLHTQSDRDRLFDRYEATTLRTETEAIKQVAALMKERPSVLVCMESLPHECHRSRLAKAVAALTRMPVRHLLPAEAGS